MILKTTCLFFLLLILILGANCKKNNDIAKEVRPIVGDYYISPSGNDANPGTKDLPFRTIKKAIELVTAGKTIVVLAGNYDEFVIIKKSVSSEDDRIIIFSETLQGAKVIGFEIESNYITIDGFDIETYGKYYVGIEAEGFSYIDIRNCLIHECPMGGIRLERGCDNAKITNNTLIHNGQAGIRLNGSDGLVESNEITTTVQFHPKGLEPSYDLANADADGMRLFGDNHLIRGNRVLNITDPADKGNIDAHSDGIQTWYGGDDHALNNTIIERNYFSSEFYTSKGLMLQASGHPINNLIIRNNIFEFRDIGIFARDADFNNLYIYNNLFVSKLRDNTSWGAAFSLYSVDNYQIFNNILVDCSPDPRKISGGTGSINYNLVWNSDGSGVTIKNPDKKPDEIAGVSPMFVTFTGRFEENDYHLQSTSPAINAGTKLSDITDDFDGVSRNADTLYDIGPFEFRKK